MLSLLGRQVVLLLIGFLTLGNPSQVDGDDGIGIVDATNTSTTDEVERSAPPRTMDLFLFAGQSNMVGADANPDELPQDTNDRHVWFWWATGDPPADSHDSTSLGRWQTLCVQPKGNPLPRDGANRQWGNYTSAKGGFGPEIGFARHRLQTLGDAKATDRIDFAILKVAYSGTSLEGDWDSAQKDTPGNCYGELVRQWDAAQHQARQKGISFRPAGLFWVQGESDISVERSAKYAERLRGLVDSVRQLTKNKNLPVFLALNTRFLGPDNPGVKRIIEAQKQVAESDLHCEYVDTSNASVANRVHFDAEGTLLVGKWFAQALERIQAAD